jgi:twitching motility protein PilT
VGGPGPGAAAPAAAPASVTGWLALGRELGASDLHLVPGAPPCLRVAGEITPVEGAPALDGPSIFEAARALLAASGALPAWHAWREEDRDIDIGVTLPGAGRLRVNLLYGWGEPAMEIRLVSDRIPPPDALGLPGVTRSLMTRRAGLWIFTGATGSGKSTTQAAILQEILRTRPVRVITIEDPIEYAYEHGRGIVTQREVGVDTASFERAVITALREDPDVILVGEMRDLETIRQTLRAAETGHLVLATLHTKDAPGAIDRMIDVFPPGQQEQIRVQLADVLLAVYAQVLVPCPFREPPPGHPSLRGRAAAFEVLLGPMAELYATGAMIRERQTAQLVTVMESSARMGCRTMERALAELVASGAVPEDAASEVAIRRETLARILREMRRA